MTEKRLFASAHLSITRAVLGVWSREEQWRAYVGPTADWSHSRAWHPYCLAGYGGSHPLHVRRRAKKTHNILYTYLRSFKHVGTLIS